MAAEHPVAMKARVVADTSLLRRPHTGVARWVTGLLDALDEEPGLDVLRAPGPPRIGRGPLFRPVNVTLQRWWYEVGIHRSAERWGANVLLLPGGYGAKRGRIPQLVVILDVNFLTQPGTYDPLFTRYASRIFKKSARDADCLVTISDFSRNEISEHLQVEPDRVMVIYPGLVHPLDGVFRRPIEDPYALYVGATQRHKNIGLLLDAWPQLQRNLKLAIVGQPGRDHARLAKQAEAMNGRVLLTGRVSQVELEGWYRHAEVFVFPSLTEGFGYPPLEAMQRGIPVVASAAGSLPEVLGDAAGYHDPHDPSSLVAAIEAVLDDEQLRAERVAKGRAQAATYTWTRAAGRMATLLKSLADHA